MKRVLIPIIEPLDYRRMNVYEHAIGAFYKYGEYPRWIRPPYAWCPQTREAWKK